MKIRFKIACQTECVLRSLLVSIFTPKISILRPSWHPFWLLSGTFFEPKSYQIALQDPSEATLAKTLRANSSRRRPRPPQVSQKLSKSFPKADKNLSQIDQNPMKNLCKFYHHFRCDFHRNSSPTSSMLATFFYTFWHQNRSCKRNLDFSILAFSPRREHYNSRFFYQIFMKIRFKIASETERELKSLLVPIFPPKI